MFRSFLSKLLFAVILLGLGSSFSRAEALKQYIMDEESGYDVPSEFKLKYQIPSEWLLQEDETDFLGALAAHRGNFAMQYRYFNREGHYQNNEGLVDTQSKSENSFSLEPEISLTWPNGNIFVFTPFFQFDSQDDKRNFVDIREAYVMFVGDEYEFIIGWKKIFWGVTESQNLVDVINQQDYLSTDSNSDKLGQPMLNLILLRDWGTVSAFVLPYFRESGYPGEDGRLRSTRPIDIEYSDYESSAREKNIDFAVRYSHYLGDLEFGLSYFQGTSRNPGLSPRNFAPHPQIPGVQMPTTFVPYFYQMKQIGLDCQYIAGSWLLKIEFIDQQNNIEDYRAWTTGVEYTFTGIFNSETDLSFLGEWLYDTRQYDESSTEYTQNQIASNPYGEVLMPPAFENDIMVGGRMAFNDIKSSEITLGIIRDIEHPITVITLEGARRLTDHWKIMVELFSVVETEAYDSFYDLRDDDYVSLRLAYFF